MGSRRTRQTILVYDLGGGTFDAALVAFEGKDHTVRAYDSELTIGGASFDRAIWAELVAGAGERLTRALEAGTDEDSKRRVLAASTRFRAGQVCREIKHDLSRRESSSHRLLLPDGDSVELALTRERLEALTRAEVERTLSCCRRLIEGGGYDWDVVDRVLLVGGSCRLPFIAERVAAGLGRPIRRAADPEALVCLGAALRGRPAPAAAAAAPTGPPSTRDGQLREAQRMTAAIAALAERVDAPRIADALRAATRERRVRVSTAVVGERSRGKSTLLNALLDRPALLPTDADVTTNVYLVLEAPGDDGAPEHAVVHFLDGRAERIRLDDLPAYVSETENPANRKEVDRVEVLITHPLVREGFAFLDTPGVGGLVRAHDRKTLEAIRSADALLMILDASQPITDAEIAFIARASDKARRVVFALNKTDALGAEQNLPFNRAAIARHAPDLAGSPMLALSARQAEKARRHAPTKPERAVRLRAESGLDELAEILRRGVLDPVLAGAGTVDARARERGARRPRAPAPIGGRDARGTRRAR